MVGSVQTTQQRLTPGTVGLDVHHATAAQHARVALLAPVAAPGVAHDPVLLAVLLAPAHDGDVVRVQRQPVLGENTLLVVGERAIHIDAAADRAALINLRHHRLFAGQSPVVRHFVRRVVPYGIARPTLFARTADVHVLAPFLRSGQGKARLVGNTRVLHVIVSRCGSAAGAPIAVIIAVDEDLGGELLRRPRSIRAETHPIGNYGRSRDSPARIAVGRNILVSKRRHVVESVEIAPSRSFANHGRTNQSTAGTKCPRPSALAKCLHRGQCVRVPHHLQSLCNWRRIVLRS